jgi:hypothetical protein
MLTIDNHPATTYVLNSYYGTYLEGNPDESIIKFPIPKLEAGKHTATFKVWDRYNNSSAKSFDFIAADNYRPAIIHLSAGPSPASEYVDFFITHDLPESRINVQIQVFDLAGQLQWQYQENGSSEISGVCKVRWNLTDGRGARMRPGIYVYRARISSDLRNESSAAKKLIIHTQ